MSKPKPESTPEREQLITPKQYAEVVEAVALLRKEGLHAEADEMMGAAIELRRMQRDAALVATEYGRYAESDEIENPEGK